MARPVTGTGTPAAEARAEPAIRRIGVADVRAAFAAGVEDFLATPTQLVFLGVIYPLVGLFAATAASGGRLMPLFFPLVAGLSLMGPVAALGLYEISRRRERGERPGWTAAFGALRSPAIASIAALGLMLLAILVVWVLVAEAIYTATLAGLHPDSIGGFLGAVFGTAEGWRLILWGNLAGFGFALLVLVLTAVSFPLLLDRPATPTGTALRTSVRAFLANPGPMALWGLIVAGVLLAGSLPFFVGLAVAMPVLGHATWHLYRRLVA